MHAKTLLALAVLTPTLAFAQPFASTQPSAGVRDTQIDPKTVHIDLNLDNASLPEYIAYLGDATKANFLLLNDPAVDPTLIRLPPLKLRQMSLTSALNLLTALPGTSISVDQDADAVVPTFSIVVHAVDGAPQQGNLLGAFPSSKAVTKLFPLSRMLFDSTPPDPSDPKNAKAVDEKIDGALQLIDLTLTVQGTTGERAQIQLHSPTHTLIVKGTPDQVAAVEQAIAALGPDQSDVATTLQKAKQDFEQRADELNRRNDRQIEQSNAEIEQARQTQARLAAERDQIARKAFLMAEALKAAKIADPTTQP